MKYRTGFVTNSSSSSFGAALISSFIGFLVMLFGICGKKVEKIEPTYSFRTTTNPKKGPLKCDGNPYWVYAQFVDIDENGGETVNETATDTVQFSITDGSDFVKKGSDQAAGTWRATDIYGAKTGGATQGTPQKITVTATGDYKGVSCSQEFILDYEAPPEIDLNPYKAKLLSGSGEEFEVKYKVKGGEPGAKWAFSIEQDKDADRLCSSRIEEDKKSGEEKVIITEMDTEKTPATLKDYYSTGKITLKADSGDEHLSGDIDVVVYRQGLFISDGLDRETGFVKVSAAVQSNGTFKIAELDLCFLKWDDAKRIVDADANFLADNLTIEELETEDTKSENVFNISKFEMKYDRVRQSNLSTAVFKLSVQKNIPGSADDNFKAEIPVSLVNGDAVYELTIPVKIIPAYMPGTGKWDEEYKYCKDIINKYMPIEMHEAKLRMLEKNKLAMGWKEIYDYRHECWEIARNFIIQEGKDYIAEAEEWDAILKKAEMVKWVADKSFSVVASAAFGPFGAFIVGQVYDTINDIITISFDKWDQDWYTLGSAIIWKRVGGLTEKSIEKYAFSEPSMAVKWVGMYTSYKLLTHWYFDYEGANRKGLCEAIKSTGKDLAGVAFKQGLKAFLGSESVKGFLSGDKNNLIDQKVIDAGGDKAVKALAQVADKTVDYTMLCVNKIIEALGELKINITF